MKLEIQRSGPGRKLSFRPAIEPTAAEQSRLDQIHRAFIARLQRLSEKQQADLIRVTAASGPANGVDPFTNALAAQMLKAIEVNERIVGAQNEIAEIDAMDFRRAPEAHRGQMLARKADLEKQMQEDAARAIALREDSHARARQDAVAYFREADTAAEKARAIEETTDRLRKETETKAIEDVARRRLNGERIAAGLDPLPDAE